MARRRILPAPCSRLLLAWRLHAQIRGEFGEEGGKEAEEGAADEAEREDKGGLGSHLLGIGLGGLDPGRGARGGNQGLGLGDGRLLPTPSPVTSLSSALTSGLVISGSCANSRTFSAAFNNSIALAQWYAIV